VILYVPQRCTAAGKADDCNVWHYASPSTAVQIIRPGIPDNYEHSYSRSSPGTQYTFFFWQKNGIQYEGTNKIS